MQDSAAQDNRNLAKRLTENLVEMTSQNPNRALDKPKKENVPITDLIEILTKLPNETKSLLKDIFNAK